jgi:hypothetical protein
VEALTGTSESDTVQNDEWFDSEPSTGDHVYVAAATTEEQIGTKRDDDRHSDDFTLFSASPKYL